MPPVPHALMPQLLHGLCLPHHSRREVALGLEIVER